MHIELAKVTWVGQTQTRIDHKGGTGYSRDFVAQWLDKQCGKYWSVKFTVWNNMESIRKLSVGSAVTLDFEVTANESNGRWYNNTRILGQSLRVYSRTGQED